MADSSILSVSEQGPAAVQLPASASASSLLDETEPAVLLQDTTAVLSGEGEAEAEGERGNGQGQAEQHEQEQGEDALATPLDDGVTSPPAVDEQPGEWTCADVPGRRADPEPGYRHGQGHTPPRGD